MEQEEIEELKNEGILDYLYSHCYNENAEIVLQLFLNRVLETYDGDMDKLTNSIVEELENMEEN